MSVSPEDLIMVGTFVAVAGGGVGYQVVRALVSHSPRARIRQRLMDNVADLAAVALDEPQEKAAAPRTFSRLAEARLVKLLLRLKAQLDHMGGVSGLRTLVLAAALGIAAAVAGGRFLGLTPWLVVAAALALGVAGGVLGFVVVVRRYRALFINGFPDALDLMIRAVRAGVPVVHAIITAGRELPFPVGREFSIMGDALRLGMDSQEVMDAASKRIGVADFRFFVVCLQLQRETGGPLADTLENLSGIIRARREVRLKTRAVTAQGRAASKIIALVPCMVLGVLKLVGADYINVLFDTERGQRLLWLAAAMVLSGLFIISRMAKLED